MMTDIEELNSECQVVEALAYVTGEPPAKIKPSRHKGPNARVRLRGSEAHRRLMAGPPLAGPLAWYVLCEKHRGEEPLLSANVTEQH